MTGVLGITVIVVLVVFVLPLSFLMGGTVLSAVLGYLLAADAEARHEGSELIDLNG